MKREAGVVRNQEELDALISGGFERPTTVRLAGGAFKLGSRVLNARFEAYGSARVKAYGSAQVEASGRAQVTAYGRAQVTAYGSAQVEAYGSAQVTASGSAQVTAYGSAQVTAAGSAQVKAYDRAQVTASGSAQVTAYGSAQVEAYSDFVTVLALLHGSILIDRTNEGVAILRQHPTAKVILQPAWEHTKESFLDIYPADEDGFVTLYKVTTAEGYDHYTGRIKYEGVVECPDWIADPSQQCGNGLHLSPTPSMALHYHNGPLKRCRVHIDDFVVYSMDITKVRCRKAEVLEDVE